MKARSNFVISAILMAGDIVVLNLSILFAYWFRFSSGIIPVHKGTPSVGIYLQVLPVLTIILIFLMRSSKLYSVKARLSMMDELFGVIKVSTLGMLIFMAGTFLYREFSFSRGMLIIAWIVLIISLSSWRFAANRMRIFLRKINATARNLLIIGDGEMVERLINHISGDPHWDYDVKGIVRIRSRDASPVSGVPVVGKLTAINDVIDKLGIQEVILTETDLPRSETMELVFACERAMVEFRLLADLLGMVTSEVDMVTIDGIPLLGLKDSPLSEGMNRFIKRAMDIALSLFGLVVLSPLFLALSVLVKLSSPGPVFYFQKRIGEDGKRFTIIKFRTMVDNAEKGVGRVWAVEGDPRRTRLGAFLRSYNLDEIPQIINVLKGDMSLVGPRPERPHFVGKFKEDVPRYMARHKIKSGLTGWAQVNGLRGNTSIKERTKYDLYYIENWSLTFDLKILLMTLFAVKNAY